MIVPPSHLVEAPPTDTPPPKRGGVFVFYRVICAILIDESNLAVNGVIDRYELEDGIKITKK